MDQIFLHCDSVYADQNLPDIVTSARERQRNLITNIVLTDADQDCRWSEVWASVLNTQNQINAGGHTKAPWKANRTIECTITSVQTHLILWRANLIEKNQVLPQRKLKHHVSWTKCRIQNVKTHGKYSRHCTLIFILDAVRVWNINISFLIMTLFRGISC
jgi:hypothetical protein